jgi:hypothetical protein
MANATGASAAPLDNSDALDLSAAGGGAAAAQSADAAAPSGSDGVVANATVLDAYGAPINPDASFGKSGPTRAITEAQAKRAANKAKRDAARQGAGAGGAGGGGGGGGVAPSAMASTFSVIFSSHNAYRQRHQAGPLAWSDTVAASAQSWANQLASRCGRPASLSCAHAAFQRACMGRRRGRVSKQSLGTHCAPNQAPPPTACWR